MKEKWIDEQVFRYRELNNKELREKIVSDLLDAIDFFLHDDLETTYRLTGGVAAILYKNYHNEK